jgi:hypothetical protein
VSTPEPLATPEEVAAHLGRSVQALAQLRFHGTGPAFIRTGRLIRYRWEDVAAWVQAGSSTRTAPENSTGANR